MPSEPTTPTGRRLYAKTSDGLRETDISGDDILAIEAEAREQERALAGELAEALGPMAVMFHASHDPCECPSFRQCHVNVCGRNKRALAKWEASRAK